MSECSHFSLSGLERSLGECCLSTLLWGEEVECAGDESLPQVVYRSTTGRYISVLVKCASSASAYLHGNNYFGDVTVFLLFNQLSWCQKKEMKHTIRDQRFCCPPVGQVHHLFYSKLVLVGWK